MFCSCTFVAGEKFVWASAIQQGCIIMLQRLCLVRIWLKLYDKNFQEFLLELIMAKSNTVNRWALISLEINYFISCVNQHCYFLS